MWNACAPKPSRDSGFGPCEAGSTDSSRSATRSTPSWRRSESRPRCRHRIPNGVDTERFRPAQAHERAEHRRRLALPDGPTAVFCGRLVPEKRIDLLLEAWRGVRRAATGCLARDRRRGPRGDRRCVGSADPRVHFAGESDDVLPYLQCADVFAMPSATEGLSNAMLEAMAVGLPIVTTRVGAAAEVVSDPETGSLVRPGDAGAFRDALEAVLFDPAARRARRARARAHDRRVRAAVRRRSTHQSLRAGGLRRGFAATCAGPRAGGGGERVIYVVLGMHKSGTTLVARVLHESGISMGEFDSRLGYGEGNRYERHDAQLANRDLLRGYQIPSLDHLVRRRRLDPVDAAGYAINRDSQAYVRHRALARRLERPDAAERVRPIVERCEERGEDWGFKDPRTCLTFPAWRKVLPEHRIVVVYRGIGQILGRARTNARHPLRTLRVRTRVVRVQHGAFCGCSKRTARRASCCATST